MTSSILQKQATLVAEFEALSDWQEKYKKIIDFSNKLPVFPDELKTEEHRVRGCSSNVWFIIKGTQEHVELTGDSDSLIMKGLLSILINLYSGHSAHDIVTTPPDFIQEIGLNIHLSMNRTNGLGEILRKIQTDVQSL
jgi:cysteine desulfuration protein SufE